MPSLTTKYFGTLPYEASGRFRFPNGIPGFEDQHAFVLLDVEERRPLLFLQSTAAFGLCFLAFPILVVDPEYELAVSFEDLCSLKLETGRQPKIGAEVLVLALLTLQPGLPATANLMAPIVINLKIRRGLQAIRTNARYSHQHAIPGVPREVAC